MKATDETVRLVWEELVETDRMGRYYGSLAQRLKRLDHLLLYGSVAGALIALTALVLRLPMWLALTALNCAALAFALQTFRNYHEKVDRSAEIFHKLGSIQQEWEHLFNNIWEKDNGELLSAWKKLSQQQLAIVERAPLELPLSRSLARRSQREADEYWSEVARSGEIPAGAEVPDQDTPRCRQWPPRRTPAPDPPQR